MVVISVFELGLEDDQDPVLQEVVELSRVRVQSLAFEVVDSKRDQLEPSHLTLSILVNELFLREINLKADHIAILNFTLRE